MVQERAILQSSQQSCWPHTCDGEADSGRDLCCMKMTLSPTLFSSLSSAYNTKTSRNVGDFFGGNLPFGQGYKSYLGPRSSAEHSLRFRDSALAGSDEFSPTPLILNAYQRLEKTKTWNVWHKRVKTHTTSHGTTTNSNSRIMWKPLTYCKCVSMPKWPSANNTHIYTHTYNPELGAQVDPLQEKWVKMERRKRFNHFSLMVQLSPERLKWEHGALPTAPDCALNHVPRKTHSLHDTKQSQLTARAEWVYNHNMCPCLQSTSENASPVVACKCHSKIKT